VAEGVAGEVVREELFGSAELAAGLARWGNNGIRLPPVRRCRQVLGAGGTQR
jgi:hypothetical protein